MSRFERTIGLIGEDGAEKLKNARVLLFGVGGVGGYVAEALIRSGVGRLDAVDGDTVADSNINRQIVALTSTIGRYKAEVFSERAKDINPEAEVTAYNLFLTRIPRRSSIFRHTTTWWTPWTTFPRKRRLSYAPLRRVRPLFPLWARGTNSIPRCLKYRIFQKRAFARWRG